MKKASFDLTGKAIDCRQLPEMGDAGKEIFRALKAACNGVEDAEYAKFKGIKHWGFLSHAKLYCDYVLRMNKSTDVIIRPVDVLGQARIDAAKDGARLVFEGDVIPANCHGIKSYYQDGTANYWREKQENDEVLEVVSDDETLIVAYKLLEEKQPSIESRVLAEKVGAKHDAGKPLYNLIPVHAEAEFVDVLTFGATKYAPNQWRNVENATERYTAAAMRHLAAYRMGETHDTESGKHHLAHAMCCLAFIIEMDLEQNK